MIPSEFLSQQTESHESDNTLSPPKPDPTQGLSLFRNPHLRVPQSDQGPLKSNESPQNTDLQSNSKNTDSSVDRSSKSKGMGFFVSSKPSGKKPPKNKEFAKKKESLQLSSSSTDSDLKTDRRMRSDFEQHMKSAV